MLGEMAVKHMAMVANKRPAKKANGIISKDSGSSISPKAHNTGSIMVALIRLLEAPHNNSPVITSSMLNGVAIIASKVF